MLKTADRRDPPPLGAAWWAWCSPCRCVRTAFAAWSAGEISLHTFDETILEGRISFQGWFRADRDRRGSGMEGPSPARHGIAVPRSRLVSSI